MRMIHSALAIAFLLLIGHFSYGQEQLGLRIENYSGVNSVLLNPVNNLSGKFKWDVNLISAGVFLENNYGYFRNTNVIEVLQKLEEIEVATDYNNETQYPPNAIIADYYDNNQKKFVSLLTNVMGPSFMVNLKSGHTFGLFTNFRTAISSQKIPGVLNYYHFDRLPYNEAVKVPPFKAAGMAWSEIGLNYGKRFSTNSGYLDFGVNLKFLQGYEGFFFNSNSNVTVNQVTADTFAIRNPDVSFGFTNANTSGDDYSYSKNGNGMALDLGVVATIEGDEGEYLWKFGFSVLDIGKINFSSNAEMHEITSSGVVNLYTDEYAYMDGVDQLVHKLSEQTLGDSTASLSQRNFGVWLPGAFSFQADYAFTPNIFINGTIIQRIAYQGNAVERGNLFALTPRFEHRWFGASLPLVVYNYKQFNFGMAMRLAFLTIGSDNIGSFFGSKDVTGTDIYFALKFNPFDLNFNFGGGGKGKGVKCYKF